MADGKVVIDVDLNDKGVSGGIDKINGQMGKIEYQGGKAALGIGKIVTALGLVAVGAKAINMVTSALDGAISRYDTLNNFPSVLQLMGFSAEESSKAINRLSEGIDGLPTTLDSVASTAQRIAIMTDDLDMATETTLALNNAFLASGSSAADAQRGLEQYVQMLSKGKVDIDAWYALQETMPVALNKVAEAFGFTGASAQNDLYDALKEGDVTFDQFNGKLIELSNGTGGFADLARTSSTGIATSWQNMRTAIVKGVTDVIEGIDEALGGVGSIAVIIDNAKNSVKTFFTFITTNIPIAVAWLAKIKDTLEPWIPILKGIVASFLAFAVLNSIISGVSTAIAVFSGLRAAMMGTAIATNAASAAQAAYNLVLSLNPIVLIAAAIIGLIVVLIQVYQKVDWFRDMVDKAWAWIKDVSSLAFSYVKDVVTKAIEDTVNLGKALLDKFKAFWDENGEAIMIIVRSTFDFVKATIETVMGIIKGIFQVVWPVITGIVKYAWESIKTFVQNGIDLVLGIIQTVLKILQGDWKGAWDSIKKTAQTIWDNIEDFFENVDLVQIGKDIIQGLIKGISSMVGAVGDAVKNVTSAITDKVKSILKIASPSKVMIQMGEWTGEGLEKGLVKSTKGVSNAAEEIAQSSMPKVGGLLNNIKKSGLPNLIGGLMPNAVSTHVVTHNNTTQLDGLVGAIKQLASRPNIIEVNGREVVYAIVDDMQEALDFKKHREVSFREVSM